MLAVQLRPTACFQTDSNLLGTLCMASLENPSKRLWGITGGVGGYASAHEYAQGWCFRVHSQPDCRYQGVLF